MFVVESNETDCVDGGLGVQIHNVPVVYDDGGKRGVDCCGKFDIVNFLLKTTCLSCIKIVTISTAKRKCQCIVCFNNIKSIKR